MGQDRFRILVLLVTYLALVIVSTIVMDWFEMTIAVGGNSGNIGVGLRAITVCQGDVCASVSFSGVALRGSYPLAASVTFWGSMLVSLLVLVLAGTRILQGTTNEALAKNGSIAAVVMIIAAATAGFVLAPDGAAMGASIERTWAPILLIVAHVVGIATMRFAVAPDEDTDARPGMSELPAARARARETGSVLPRGGDIALEPGAPRPATGPLPTMPEHLRQQLRFTVLAAELTRAGVDARREDGSTLLVMWRDVVGVVARRLPPELDGATFVDLVSTADATLRVLPWTRLTGDPVEGTDDQRARSLVALVAARCPAIKLDPVTREFLDGRGPPRQLPDAATLAAHDERLA